MAKFKLTQTANRERAPRVFELLRQAYPNAICTLDHKNPLQLLIATILSAQCTDERVNIVTKDLFKKYSRPQDYLAVPDTQLQEDIRTCGFFRQKTKSIRGVCQSILDRFDGKVPRTLEDLTSLNGVGRKTANVILGTCFNVPGIIVDTHCTRLNTRLGFTRNTDPGKIEKDLMKILPEAIWTDYSHRMVYHGRAICNARAPQCSQCVIADLCPFPHTAKGKKIAK